MQDYGLQRHQEGGSGALSQKRTTCWKSALREAGEEVLTLVSPFNFLKNRAE